ncbi:MAG: hypothetical protein K2X93_20955 [Candidatus Obscuribacterales bacterium]|nr:hypothetical protein [Candidatus Obscuribacterales bacterium]
MSEIREVNHSPTPTRICRVDWFTLLLDQQISSLHSSSGKEKSNDREAASSSDEVKTLCFTNIFALNDSSGDSQNSPSAAVGATEAFKPKAQSDIVPGAIVERAAAPAKTPEEKKFDNGVRCIYATATDGALKVTITDSKGNAYYSLQPEGKDNNGSDIYVLRYQKGEGNHKGVEFTRGQLTRFESGAWSMSDKTGKVVATLSSNGVVTVFDHDSPDPGRREEAPGSFMRIYKQSNGWECPKLQVFPNDRRLTYDLLAASPSGQSSALIEDQHPDGRRSVYEHQPDGTWKRALFSNGKKESESLGRLRFDANLLPVFEAFDHEKNPRIDHTPPAQQQIRSVWNRLLMQLSHICESRMKPELDKLEMNFKESEAKKHGVAKWDDVPVEERQKLEKQLAANKQTAVKSEADRLTNELSKEIETVQKATLDLICLEAEREALVTRLKNETLAKAGAKRWEDLPQAEQQRFDTALKTNDEFRRLQREIEILSARLSPERVWSTSPVTRTCFNDLLDWTAKTVVPAAFTTLDQSGKPIPADCPVPVPRRSNGTGDFIPTTFFGRQTDKLKDEMNLGIAKDKLPSKQDLDKLENTLRWCSDIQRREDDARIKFDLETRFPQAVRENGLPEKWLTDPRLLKLDSRTRHAVIKDMIELALNVKETAHGISDRNRQKNNQNANVAWYYSTVPVHPLPAGCTESAKGELTFTWPQELPVGNTGETGAIHALKDWQDTHRKILDDEAEILDKTADSLCRPFYGEIPGKYFVTKDANGRLNGVFTEKPEGVDCEECNLLRGDYKVEKRNGEYFLKVTVQAKKAGLIDPHNWCANDVGLPSEKEFGPFKEGQMIVVFNNRLQKVMTPVENAMSRRRWQAAEFWASNIVGTALELSIFLGSGGSAGVLLFAGKAGLKKAIPHLARTGLATASAITSGASVTSEPEAHRFHKALGTVFVVDTVVSLALKKPSPGLVEASGLAALDKASAIFRLPVKGARAVSESKTTQWAINVPFIGLGIHELSNKLPDRSKGRPYFDGQNAWGWLGGLHSGADEMVARTARTRAADAFLDSQFDMISTTKNVSATDRNFIHRSRETTKALLAARANPDTAIANDANKNIEQFKSEMLKVLRPGDGQQRSPAVRYAAALSLLVLSLKEDNSLPANILESGGAKLSSQDLTAIIRSTSKSADASLRLASEELLLRSGQTDKTPFDLARIMLNTLDSDDSDPSRKINVIRSLTLLSRDMRTIEPLLLKGLDSEQRSRFQIAGAGLMSNDLLDRLRTTSGDKRHKDDVRAMAAISLFHYSAGPADNLPAALSKESADFEQAKQNPGKYAEAVVTRLMEEARTATDPNKRLNSLVCLKELKSLESASSQTKLKDFDFNKELLQFVTSNIGPGVKLTPASAQAMADAVELLNLSNSSSLSFADRMALAQITELQNTAEANTVKLALAKRANELVTSSLSPTERTNLCVSLLNGLGKAIDLSPHGASMTGPNSVDFRKAIINSIKSVNELIPQQDESRAEDRDIVKFVRTRLIDRLKGVATPEAMAKGRTDWEPSAAVRLSALEALQAMMPTADFAAVTTSSLSHESDFAIRRLAEHAALGTYTPTRDPYWYHLLYTDACQIDGNHKFADDDGPSLKNAFLAELRALDLESVEMRTKRQINTHLDAKTGRPITYVRDVTVEERKYNAERTRKIDSLMERARAGDDKAIQVLTAIVRNPDFEISGTTGKNPDTDKDYTKAEKERLLNGALEVLCELVQPGSRVDCANTRVRSLVANPFVDPKSRLCLLQALDQAEKAKSPTVSDDYSRWLSLALQVDVLMFTNNPKGGNALKERSEFRNYLLERIDATRHPSAQYTLELITLSDRLPPQLKGRAGDILANWRDSVSSRARAVDATEMTRQLYDRVFNRAPDPAAKWAQDLAADGRTTFSELVRMAIDNPLNEFKNSIPASPEEAVRFLYRRILDRRQLPSAEEISGWVALHKTHGVDAVIDGLLNSSEFRRSCLRLKTGDNNKSKEEKAADVVRALSIAASDSRHYSLLDMRVDTIIDARGSKSDPINPGDPRIEAIRLALKCATPNTELRQLFPKDQMDKIFKWDERRSAFGSVGTAFAAATSKDAALSNAEHANALDRALFSKEENSSQMIRLAAAFVILQSRADSSAESLNTGFTDQDRSLALRECASLAWSGCEDGYRTDAMALLNKEINYGNPLALDALAEVTLGQFERHRRAFANNEKSGESTRREYGEVQQKLKDLLTKTGKDCIERTLPDGRTIVVRNKFGGIVIEEFKNGKLTGAVPPFLSGRTYTEVAVDDVLCEKNPERRLSLSQSLLSSAPNLFLNVTGSHRDTILRCIASQTKNDGFTKLDSNLRYGYALCLYDLGGDRNRARTTSALSNHQKRGLEVMLDLAIQGVEDANKFLDELSSGNTCEALSLLLNRKPLELPKTIPPAREARITASGGGEYTQPDISDLWNDLDHQMDRLGWSKDQKTRKREDLSYNLKREPTERKKAEFLQLATKAIQQMADDKLGPSNPGANRKESEEKTVLWLNLAERLSQKVVADHAAEVNRINSDSELNEQEKANRIRAHENFRNTADALLIATYLEAATILGTTHPQIAAFKLDAVSARLKSAPIDFLSDLRSQLLLPENSPLPADSSQALVRNAVTRALQLGDATLLNQYAQTAVLAASNPVSRSSAEVFARTARTLETIGRKTQDRETLESTNKAFRDLANKVVEMFEVEPNTEKSQEWVNAIETFFRSAPPEVRLELAEKLQHSANRSLEHLSFKAIGDLLFSTDESMRQRADGLLKSIDKSKWSELFRAIGEVESVGRPSSTKYYDWFIQLAEFEIEKLKASPSAFTKQGQKTISDCNEVLRKLRATHAPRP